MPSKDLKTLTKVLLCCFFHSAVENTIPAITIRSVSEIREINYITFMFKIEHVSFLQGFESIRSCRTAPHNLAFEGKTSTTVSFQCSTLTDLKDGPR